MRCSRCGTELPPNTAFCPACGSQNNVYGGQQMQGQMNYNYGQPMPGQMNYGGQPMPPVQINTYMVPAILATIFCCLPFGIVSIVYASKANSAVGVGNFQQAQQDAEKAKTWFWLAFAFGLVSSIIGAAIQIFAAAATAAL
ncbi:MAG: CD225/dispanin family protein [Lentisphaeria bacterium]|nr:CD225/dispanin family protein [Lentisphaeria bacterium]